MRGPEKVVPPLPLFSCLKDDILLGKEFKISDEKVWRATRVRTSELLPSFLTTTYQENSLKSPSYTIDAFSSLR